VCASLASRHSVRLNLAVLKLRNRGKHHSGRSLREGFCPAPWGLFGRCQGGGVQLIVSVEKETPRRVVGGWMASQWYPLPLW